uniref:EndoU nuclease n=1 Tax=Candidatus Kentrum sp. SD TaxID=2126332 RepID=A0A450YDP9_9GAMM|nr:MAG: EndoU nuclease [Candidatus Kentron sp. SD]
MSSSPAPSPPRYPNPCIQENSQAIETLKKQISKEIKGSYAFTFGKQERDERFQKLFADFFKELRGPEPLINETAQVMADRFIERPDISNSYTPCGNPFQTLYAPSPELVEALESIIEREYGLQDQFLEALDANEKELSALELEDRDTQYRDYYVVCRLFPRCVDTLKAIFKDLLIVEWLRQDSGNYRLVRANTEAIASLWQVSKQSVEDQKATDAKLSEKHWRDLKTDLYQTASSGALSLYTKKPQFVVSQVAKLGMNVIGRKIDPEGRNKWMKGFNMLGSALVSKGFGGNTRELVTSLSVDVAELAQRSENTSKEKALLRGYASALTKGAFLRDTKKLTSQILGFVASTGAEVLPKAKKSEAYRALRATLTNSDIHGHFIDKGVERYFREPEKPTPKVEELAQVEESKEKEQFDGQWLEDVFHEKLSHVAVEEQVAIETAQEINQKIDQLKRDISKKDEAIRIGTEHLNNLQSSGEVVDIAQYEVKKKSGDWRVYRNGEELYADNTSNAQKTCYEMIPELQKKYGSPIHTQKYKEASTALDRANSEKLKLVEALGSLQKKQLPPDMIEQYERGFIEYKQQLESQRQREVEGQRLTNKLMEKNRGVESAYNYLDDKIDGYNRHYKRDEYYSKLKSAVKNYNNALQERDAVVNQIYALNGDPKRISTPLEKIPPKATKWEKSMVWIDKNVEININLSTSMPLYQMKEPKSTGYTLLQEPTNPEPKTFTFQDTQELQNQQIFQENMSFKSAQQAQGTAQYEISQHSGDMSVLWGNGVDRNVQSPPVNTQQAIESGIREAITTRHNPIMEMSGLAPFVLSKVIPKRTQEKVKTWISDYVQEIKNDPLQARKDLDVAVILGAKKAVVVAIQAFEQPSLKQRPNTYGLMEASNRFDRWIAGKVNVNLDSRNAQIGMFVAEIFAPMGMCKTARPVMKVGQEAIQFIRSTQRARPLVDRVLLSPETFGRELRAIQAMQNPVHRSGFVGEKAVQQARKAVNLPSWKNIPIKMKHVLSGHTGDGWRTGCKGSNKSLFPEGMTKQQIETAIRQAYRNGKKVKTVCNRTTVIGEYQGMKIKMYVNTEDKIIESAYPKK